MLVVTVICLGVRYLQVSQQFQQASGVLEVTNSSLLQQLQEKTRQVEQKEVALRESQRELTSSQQALQEKQKTHEATEKELQDCQSEGQKTRDDLGREEEQTRNLRQQLTNLQVTLKRFFSCSSGTCSGIREMGRIQGSLVAGSV